jgi:hypothetical protein
LDLVSRNDARPTSGSDVRSFIKALEEEQSHL